MNRDQLARILKWGALLVLGLYFAFWVFMGVGEMAGGDWSGASHLVPAIVLMGLALLAGRRPLAGGLLLLAFGLAVAAFYASVITRADRLAILALTSGPLVVSGLLCLGAGVLMRPARPA